MKTGDRMRFKLETPSRTRRYFKISTLGMYISVATTTTLTYRDFGSITTPTSSTDLNRFYQSTSCDPPSPAWDQLSLSRHRSTDQGTASGISFLKNSTFFASCTIANASCPMGRCNRISITTLDQRVDRLGEFSRISRPSEPWNRQLTPEGCVQ